MRLKQLQQANSVKTHYRLYKSGKKWCVAMVTLVGGSCLGVTLLTQPITVNAATTTTTSISSMTTDPKVTSAAPVSSVTATPTSATVGTSVAGSAMSAMPSSMSSAVSATSALSATATSAVVPVASSSATSAATTNPTSSTSVPTSASPGSAAAVSSTVASSASTVPADSTVVTFGDAGVAAAVQASLGVTGPVTIGDIRQFKGSIVSIGTDSNILMVNGTLAGIQALQYLPAKALVQLVTQYPSANIDLTPLMPVHFSEIGIMVHDMNAVNLAPLLKVDPSKLNEIQLVGSIAPGITDYQTNADGLTNAQLAELSPWLTAIDNNDTYKSFNFDEGSLTDFSPLSGFTKMAYIVAVGQRLNVAEPVNLVIGQPAVFEPTPIIGLKGDSLTSKYEITWNGAAPTSAGPTQAPLTKLADGRFEIPTAYQAVPNADWFTYGFNGIAHFKGNRADFITVNYPNNITFRYDSMIYQVANWQTAPQVYIRYIDSATNQPIQPFTSNPGGTIGTAYDFTKLTQLSGYRFLPTSSSQATGNYTQDPQYLTFAFAKLPVPAGGVTISYVDPTGQAIAPAKTITGDVGDTYTSAPISIPNYSYQQLGSGSLAATGTLPVTAGKVVYQYVPLTVQRTVTYLDTTTQKVLQQQTLTGDYQSTPANPTLAPIKTYLATGYQLVTSDFPATLSPFASPQLTGNYTVQLAHRQVTWLPNDSLPLGMNLVRVITQTVSFRTANGRELAPSMSRKITFQRTATVDQVSGATQYSPWEAVEAPTFTAITVPKFAAYRSSLAQIRAVPVSALSADLAETVSYQPVQSTVKVDYQLAGSQRQLQPAIDLTGEVGQVYRVMAPAIAGYQVVTRELAGKFGAEPTRLVFDYVPVTSTLASATGRPMTAHFKSSGPALLKNGTQPQVVQRLLPQTSEQQPVTIWKLLGLLLFGFVGPILVRKRH